ncbi:MAG: ATP synthase F0 subunit C [Chloroflexota bacterium]|nr:ATP synthase F0 subunit C [Anaerolineae bacterium]
MESNVLVVVIMSIAPLVAITLGCILPAWVEGKAVLKALDAMARQPEVADEIRTTLIVSLAMLETTAIYVLLVCLILLFANPLLALLAT